MSTSFEDPIVNLRRLFPLSSTSRDVMPQAAVLVPYGVRYAVPPVVVAADKNAPPPPTSRRVSINTPTTPDGNGNQPMRTDDMPSEGID